jgi:hypothetical protein
MIKRHLAGLTVAALVAGGGAAAWAAAPDGSSAGTPAPSQAAKNRPGRAGARGGMAGIAGRVVHGDLIVRGKGGTFENVTLDRGTLSAKGDNSLTLSRPDGKSVTVKVDGSTKYRGVSDFAALQTGKPTIVASKDGVATLVAQRVPGGNTPNPANVGA